MSSFFSFFFLFSTLWEALGHLLITQPHVDIFVFSWFDFLPSSFFYFFSSSPPKWSLGYKDGYSFCIFPRFLFSILSLSPCFRSFLNDGFCLLFLEPLVPDCKFFQLPGISVSSADLVSFNHCPTLYPGLDPGTPEVFPSLIPTINHAAPLFLVTVFLTAAFPLNRRPYIFLLFAFGSFMFSAGACSSSFPRTSFFAFFFFCYFRISTQ